MARRRRIQGRPLLVATATAAAAIVIGCSSGTKNQPPPPGNLMPPPTTEVEVCVDTVPEDATVSIYAASSVVFSERCEKVEVYEGGQTSKLQVEADGYQTKEQDVMLEGPKVELKVELQSNKIPEAEPPVGNLMPPPLEPPVGNLMPPQEVEIREPAPSPDPSPTPDP